MPLEIIRLLRILPDMDHFGTGICHLFVGGNGYGIELADGIVALQDHAGIFPGDGGAGFHLRPADLGVLSFADAAFGHEVVDTAFPVFIAGVPVLNGRVLDLRVVQRNKFHHCGVQLVLVAHRGGAAFQVAYVAAFVGNDEGALKLAGVLGVDAEVSG